MKENMIKAYHIFSHKNKSAIIILLSLFFVMIGSCPIQKLITGDFYAQLETPKQSKATLSATNYQSTCSISDEVVKEPLLSIGTFSAKNFNPLLLVTAVLGENMFLFKRESGIFEKQNSNLLASSFPLFLKYRVLII